MQYAKYYIRKYMFFLNRMHAVYNSIFNPKLVFTTNEKLTSKMTPKSYNSVSILFYKIVLDFIQVQLSFNLTSNKNKYNSWRYNLNLSWPSSNSFLSILSMDNNNPDH